MALNVVALGLARVDHVVRALLEHELHRPRGPRRDGPDAALGRQPVRDLAVLRRDRGERLVNRVAVGKAEQLRLRVVLGAVLELEADEARLDRLGNRQLEPVTGRRDLDRHGRRLTPVVATTRRDTDY